MSLEDYASKAAIEAPTHLYKYRSLAAGDRTPTGDQTRQRVRDLIVNQRLYFAAPADLNDPFECKPHLETNATAAQQRQHAADLVQRHERHQPRAERRRQTKVMQGDPNDSEVMMASMRATLGAMGIFSLSAKHDDLLMWPHYADNHRGICVRFNLGALLDADCGAFPVLYRDERPVCDVILERTEDWLNKAVLTKGKPWEYEDEIEQIA